MLVRKGLRVIEIVRDTFIKKNNKIKKFSTSMTILRFVP